MIQTQNMVIQSIHAQERQLAKTIAFKNEKTLPYQSLTDFDIFYPIDVTKESYCFVIQDSISTHLFELPQNFETTLTFLQILLFTKLSLSTNVVRSLKFMKKSIVV